MRKRRSGKSTASLAGWLFADLTLVLFVVSLSSAESNAACPKPKKGAEIPEWCTPSSTPQSTTTTSTTSTTTTTVPDTTVPGSSGSEPGGIKPEPVEIVLTSWRPGSLGSSLDKELEKVYEKDSNLRALGSLDDIKFGVVFIYGGAKGVAARNGDMQAKRAADALLDEKYRWSRITDLTYIDAVHDLGLVPSGLKFKLFPELGG